MNVTKSLTSLFSIILLLLSSVLAAAVAQASAKMEFLHLSVRHGLSDNQVKCIHKDRSGYLWIGTTSGLNRYDGFRIKTYYRGEGDGSSLSDDNISEIHQDADGCLWLRTSVGYSRLDLATGTFDNDLGPWLAQRGMGANLRHVFVDSRQRLWLHVMDEGVYCMDRHGKATFVPQTQFPDAQVTAITEDNGVGLLTFDDGSLVGVDGDGGTVMWTNRHIAESIGEKRKFYATFVDKWQNYWVYSDNTLQMYNPATHQWQALPGLIVKDMAQDHHGRIWAATDHSGLVAFDRDGRVIESFTYNPDSHNSISDNTLISLHVDDLGTLWIGTFRNGLNYHYEGQTVFGHLPMGDACTILQDDAGLLWCGTNDAGINCYDPSSGRLTNIGKQRSGLGSDIVVCSLKASDGSLWFGTYKGGLVRIVNGRFTVYRKQAGALASDDVWALAETSDGRIIIGTLGSGVQVLHVATGHYDTYNTSNSSLASDYISSLFVDADDNIYIGHSHYFSILSSADGTITNYASNKRGEAFCSPAVNYLFLDSRRILWVATTSGLNAYDMQTDELYTVTEQGEARNVDTYALTEDHGGCIWATSAQGMRCIRPTRNEGRWDFFINSYGESYGQANRAFNRRSIYTTAAGDILAGSIDGVRVIAPSKLKRDHDKEAHVLFSGLLIFDHEVGVGQAFNGRVVLERSLDSSRQLTLGSGDNAFTIQLAASNVGVPERSRFMYRLSGLSDRWTATAESQPNVTFTNLSPGHYTLEVRLIDDMGRMQGEVSTLSITVRPPLYLSRWAFAAYLAMGALMVWLVWRRQRSRRRQQQLLREAEKQREIDEMKLRFFTNVNHELRTPLTMILSPLHSLLQGDLSPDVRQKLKFVNRNAMKLLEMVNKMLDMRRLMKEGERLNASRGDIVPVVKSICDQYAELTDKRMSLTFYSSATSIVMAFDRDKLAKIVNNLLSNAFKFTPDGGRVDVSLKALPTDRLELKVADSGTGISDYDKRHVFERFYQSSQKSASGGSGVGLNIVMEYTRMHGGDVRIEDNPGGGSVFIVTLPMQQAEASSQELVAVSQGGGQGQEPSAAQAAPSQAREILIVDDSDDFLEFMTSELSRDYRISVAHNGVEALSQVAQRHPHLILTDVMMPEMDGNELCQRLKADAGTRRIPVIMLTARLSEEHEIESRECGADDYITKPFSMELLQLRIATLINRGQAIADGKIDPRITPEVITPLDQQLVADATAYVEAHLADPDLSVETMSQDMGMSRVKLYRRLLTVTGNTPSEFIRLIRLRHAEQLLAKSQLSIAEISYRVGFSTPRYFSKCYKELYGYMPSQYKKQSKDGNKVSN